MITQPSVSEENKIEELADGLYRRIEKETEKLLKSQLTLLGVDVDEIIENKNPEGLQKIVFPEDSKALAIYEYKGRQLLGLKISDSGFGIEFDVPDLETQTQGEVQDV